MEITSGILTEEQFLKEIEEMPELLSQLGINYVLISFGYGCNEDLEDLWKERQISVDDIADFLQQNIDSGLFTPTTGDLFIKSNEHGTEILFCHESDIHFKTSNENAFQMKRNDWISKEFQGYTKVKDDWIPFTDGN